MGVLGFRRLTPKTCFKFDAKVQHFWCTNQEESLWEMRIEVGGERAVKSEECSQRVPTAGYVVNNKQWTEVINHWSLNIDIGMRFFACVVGAICKSPYAVACVFSSNSPALQIHPCFQLPPMWKGELQFAPTRVLSERWQISCKYV